MSGTPRLPEGLGRCGHAPEVLVGEAAEASGPALDEYEHPLARQLPGPLGDQRHAPLARLDLPNHTDLHHLPLRKYALPEREHHTRKRRRLQVAG